MPTAVAFQGIAGSFSHLASIHCFGSDLSLVSCEQFREIFEAVRAGRARYGVVPVENSIAGAVHENLDLLSQSGLWVCREYYLRVEHQLLVSPGEQPAEDRLKILRKVYSHPKALEQCTRFFDAHPWIEKVVFSDTARAAQHVASQGDPSLAAIASREASEHFGLAILRRNIEDSSTNLTRFQIVSREQEVDPHRPADKCSLVFSLAHEPGSLKRAISLLSDRGYNLTRIESRPIPGQRFEYLFHIDFEFTPPEAPPASLKDLAAALIGGLESHTKNLQVLGIYPKG